MAVPLLLLVEDSPEITFIVQRYARRGGYEVAACATVSEAWDWLKAEGSTQKAEGRRQKAEGESPPSAFCLLPSAFCLPDLVLLDVNLPGENGLELCRRLQAVPELAAVPVAIFGHWDRPEDIAAGIEAGAEFLLTKDLLARPEAWQTRLGEILTPADSRPPLLSLSWNEQCRASLSAEFLEALNQVLWQPAGGSPDAAVTHALARRALHRAGRQAGLAANVLDGCLGPHGLLPDRIARAGRPDVVRAFVVALAEQLWCLLGTAASAPCREALAAAVLTFTGMKPR
jgi:CheY-like chemotaxis protein